MSEVEVYLPTMRGAAVTIGKRTHVLLQTKRPPSWAQELNAPQPAPTLGNGLLGLVEYVAQMKAER